MSRAAGGGRQAPEACKSKLAHIHDLLHVTIEVRPAQDFALVAGGAGQLLSNMDGRALHVGCSHGASARLARRSPAPGNAGQLKPA
ncbi:hypothetical protein [Mesorhizobium sp. ANAO-SY3R2]|uniref:hypothetical protein n=1 Tax=Mesorhizobium sp. ANAO-SY3R2 TaxID=3166644 RepID=UPI003672FCDD